MLAVIFEVKPKVEEKEDYLKIAAGLRSFLENREGFISIERFQSLNEDGKILSLSFWRDEAALEKWRNLLEHRAAQKKGGNLYFIFFEPPFDNLLSLSSFFPPDKGGFIQISSAYRLLCCSLIVWRGNNKHFQIILMPSIFNSFGFHLNLNYPLKLWLSSIKRSHILTGVR